MSATDNPVKPVLEIRNLSIALPANADRKLAVNSVSLTVNPREIVCLVGESGSGKSVIAHSVMGLLPAALKPMQGEILLNGENVLTASADRLRELRCTRMSMIFQEPMTALNPVLTCGDQIDEVLAQHTKDDAETRRKKTLEIIGQVGLPDPPRMVASYPHQLSGGQRQRIMIAIALVLDPILLIADEPTTALDVTTQAQVLALVRDLQRDHATAVLFITHDFGVVAEIAHRVAVLRLGQLVEFGTRDAVLKMPQHDYTKMLIGSVPSIHPRVRALDEAAPVVLETKGLGKTYPPQGFFKKSAPVTAATDVSFTVKRGQTLGIVGESGSGKSTVARCIVRLIDPTAGEITIKGDEFARASQSTLRALRRKVQIVFQDPYRSLNPRRTVGDSIIEGPMNYGTPRSEAMQRARDLMEFVKLDPNALTRYPHQFSGGQRQRIAIARALAMEPELLIADEAVSALDVSVQAQVLKLLDDIKERLNLAMLFITHDLRVAAQVCDHVAVMSKGRMVEYGAASQVFGAPQHEYTKSLFAAAPGRGFSFGSGAA